MKCILCGGKTVQKKVPYQELGIPFGEFKAEVCGSCNGTYFDENIAEEIQKKSQRLGLFGMVKKAKVAELGNSVAIRIPKEMAAFLNLKKGQHVTLLPKN